MKRVVITLIGLVLLASCSSATPGASTPQTQASSIAAGPTATGTVSPAASAPAAKAVSITLADGKAEPNGERVELVRGQHLVLTITSDRDDEVHVHGIDLEIPVTPGAKVTKDIVMDRIGRFEVESHEPELTILVLTVQ